MDVRRSHGFPPEAACRSNACYFYLVTGPQSKRMRGLAPRLLLGQPPGKGFPVPRPVGRLRSLPDSPLLNDFDVFRRFFEILSWQPKLWDDRRTCGNIQVPKKSCSIQSCSTDFWGSSKNTGCHVFLRLFVDRCCLTIFVHYVLAGTKCVVFMMIKFYPIPI